MPEECKTTKEPRTPKEDPFARNKRQKVDPLDRIQQDGFLGYRASTEEENTEAQPALTPDPEPGTLPPWLAHFQMLPINRIRAGHYQQRRAEPGDPVNSTHLEQHLYRHPEQGT